MLVYGRNVAKELLENGKIVQKIILQDGFSDKEINSLIEKRKVPVQYKSKREIDRLAPGVHQGIILFIPDYKYKDISDVLDDEAKFFVILDHLEDPHNLGAIIRTCEAAKVDAIIMPKDRQAQVNSTVMKTSAGTLDNVNIVTVTNLVSTIDELKKNKIKTVMLTGDGKNAGKAVAEKLGLDEVYAELLPQDKVSKIEQFLAAVKNKKERVAFAGDGINDAPVLSRSDIGIAMGGLGSDAAIEAADVVIMDDMPSKIPQAISIAKKTMVNALENSVFALTVKFAIIVCCTFGIANMWMAVFGDVGVTLLAVLNSLRLLAVKKIK